MVIRTPAVAAVIVNWNGDAVLGEALDSLCGQEYNDLRVIVVDNGSADNSRAIARRFPVELIEMPGNAGLASALGAGARAAEDVDFLLFFNNDVVLPQGLISRAVSRLERLPPSVFALDFCQTATQSSRTVHGTIVLKTAGLLTGQLPGWCLESIAVAGPSATVYASSAGCIVRADAYRQIGGWDASFPLGWEDVDLSLRAWAAGLEVVHCPNLTFQHIVGHSTSRPGADHFHSRGVAVGRLLIAIRYFPVEVVAMVAIRLMGGMVASVIRLRWKCVSDRLSVALRVAREAAHSVRMRRAVSETFGSPRRFVQYLVARGFAPD